MSYPERLRQADVEQRYGGLEFIGGLDRLGAVVGGADLVAHHVEQRRQAVGRVFVVVHHEDSLLGSGFCRGH